MMRYALSPEFHRNLWLKCTPLRLAAVPILLAIMTAAIFNFRGPVAGAGDIHSIVMGLYLIIVFVWGNYEAGTALQEEARSNTWDFQRMSSISAAQLAFGKLFGATSFIWYCGLMLAGLGVYTLQDDADNGAANIFFMIMAGLLGHAVAFLASLTDMSLAQVKTSKRVLSRSVLSFLLGLVVSVQVFYGVSSEPSHRVFTSGIGYWGASVSWYGEMYGKQAFFAASLCFFLFWFLLGSYRLVRAELMHRTMPSCWLLFVVSFMIFLAGLIPGEGTGFIWGTFGLYLQAVLIAYGVLLFEAGDMRKYARFFAALQVADLRRAAENAPKWLATIPVILVLYVLALARIPEEAGFFTRNEIAVLMLSLLVFAVRDGLVIHAIQLGSKTRAAGFKLMFYYLLVYVLLPAWHLSASNANVNSGNLLNQIFASGLAVPPGISHVTALYYPSCLTDIQYGILPQLLQAAAAGGWLFYTLRAQRQKVAKSVAL